MNRKLWLLAAVMGLAFGIVYTMLFLFLIPITISDKIALPAMISLAILFTVLTLYIVQKRRVELNWKRSFMISLWVLTTGIITLYLLALVRSYLIRGYASIRLEDLGVLLILIGCAAAISAIVALFFRKSKIADTSSSTLDDPNF